MKFFFRNYCVERVRQMSAIGALILVTGFGWLPAAGQQDPANQPAAVIEQPGAAEAQPAAPGNQPGTTMRQPADSNLQRHTPPPEAAEAQFQRVPINLTLKRGTIITARTSQFISSDQNQPGDSFAAELQQPVVVDGWVVARRGQTILGRVVTAHKAGRVKGTSQLGIELNKVILVDGQQVAIRSQLMQMSGDTSKGRDAAAVGTTTGLGTAIGAASATHEGAGAGVGAGVGAIVGLAGVLLTRGHPTVIPPETTLTFELESPIAFSTERSGPAFRPVAPEDYSGGEGRLQRRPSLAVAPYGPMPPYYDPWFGPWSYPGPFYVGFYHFGGRRHYRGFHR